MLYLLGLVFWWIRDAFLPAVCFGGGACVVWLVLGLLFWRDRTKLRRHGLAVLLGGTLVWLAAGTRDVLFRFDHPQFEMFTSCVADPIPPEVQDLEVDSAAPAMFTQGALLRFRAPAELRRALLAHTLPGTRTRAQAAILAERFDRDPAIVARIADANGGYLRYDPVAFAAFDVPEWAFAVGRLKDGPKYDTLRPAPVDHELWVYGERGDWGTLVCVATVARDSDRMTLHVMMSASGRRR